MTINTSTIQATKVDAGYETSKFALGVGISTAALIAVWSTVCLISAFMNNGVVEVTKGLLGAMGI